MLDIFWVNSYIWYEVGDSIILEKSYYPGFQETASFSFPLDPPHGPFQYFFFRFFCIFKCWIFSTFCNSLSFLLPKYSPLGNLNKGWTSIIPVYWWLLNLYLYPRLLWTLDTFIELSILYLLLVISKKYKNSGSSN